jgi:signal transduction histidine kinase
MITLLMLTESKLEEKRLEAFASHGDTIINKLQNENVINVTWLTQIESKNNLILYIEDNGNPLTFKGVLNPLTDRYILLGRLRSLAMSDGITIAINPVFFNVSNSQTYTIKGDNNDIYYGFVSVIPTETGWRSLTLLQYLPDYYSSVTNQRILYTVLGFAGVLALFLVSLRLISRMIRPIEESNRSQTAFIAAASHELRSPLSVIMANSAAISATSDETKRFLSGINNECKRMSRLIDDMLLLANIDTKTWQIKSEPVEIDTLLVEAYEVFLPLFRLRGLSFELDLQEEELPIISGDKDRLKQILCILLDNAMSYTATGQKVLLRGYNTEHHLHIEVEDQGIGITDEDKKLIFDRFYRADPSRSDKKHFGLGLSIANELVQYHNGKMSVRDTEGGGATFSIRLRV